jgi:multiple sugar transport system permease protein
MLARMKNNNLRILSLLLPGLLIFAFFTIYPIIKLFIMSFFEWDLGSVFKQRFIGLENYRSVLSDETFRITFINTIVYTFVTVPSQILLGLLVAVLIHNIPRLKISFRLTYYLPVITSWVIASLVFKYIFNTEGLLNYFLKEIVSITDHNIRWLDNRLGGLSVAMLLGTWKGIGWNMVVFLAALQTVPEELYEAAEIDGAGSFKRFIKITIPYIKGTILFAVVMLTIGGFNVFTSIKLITGGQPAHQTDTVLTWMYYKAFSTGEFGYSAALSFIIAITLGILAVIQFKVLKKEY